MTAAAATTPATATPATGIPATGTATAAATTTAAIATRAGSGPPVDAPDPVGSPLATPRLRLLRYEPDATGPARRRPVTAPAQRPQLVVAELADSSDVRRRIEWVLRLALEVLDGRRPLAQLAPHLAPSAVRYMRAALARRPPLREPSRMTSLHVGRPGAGVAEVAVVYRRGLRARALAARFEQGRLPRRTSPGGADRPEWRCVCLRLL